MQMQQVKAANEAALAQQTAELEAKRMSPSTVDAESCLVLRGEHVRMPSHAPGEQTRREECMYIERAISR